MKRQDVLQGGEVIKDYFNPYEPEGQAFQVVHFKYAGWTCFMYDTYEAGVITSVMIMPTEPLDIRKYKFKDVFKIGNHKLPDKKDERPCGVFNLSSARDCPALEAGECLVADDDGNGCYAYEDENMYKTPLYYRRRQEMFFRMLNEYGFAELALGEMKGVATDFRVNEAGDFRTQDDVRKLNLIAMFLSYYDIKTYTYTSRRSFNWSELDRSHLTIIGSSMCGLDGQFIASENAKEYARKARSMGFRAIVCPTDCRKCTVCPEQKEKPTIVYAQKH